jgi:sugar phosphate permease
VAVNGINVLLLASVPLSFGDGGHVAAVAGFLDFAAYVGGGVSGVVVGQLLDGPGWNAAFSFWLGATLLSAAGAVLLGKRTQEASLTH